LNGVSLFSGIGGLELALHQEVKTVAYVEREPYPQAVLVKRQEEGVLDKAPIYDDVRTFDGTRYRGVVDIVFGGFPCQDISVAGKGAGIKEDTRSGLFFELMRVVREIRPTFIFLENVSAITQRGMDTVLAEVFKAGYDARWTTIRASDVGARHRRERWFCLGYLSNTTGVGCGAGNDNTLGEIGVHEEGLSLQEDDKRSHRGCGTSTVCGNNREGDVAYSDSEGLQGWEREHGGESPFGLGSGVWDRDPAEETETSESFVGRVADGIPKRVDRLKCLGNAVVPQQGRLAWDILTNKKSED